MARTFELGDPAKRVFSLFDEFKGFALKGNVVDLAVGVIIGAAFAGLVKSLTDNIVKPIVGLASSDLPGSYREWHIGPVMIGNFLGDIISFFILAIVLFFFIVKFLGWIMRSRHVDPPPP